MQRVVLIMFVAMSLVPAGDSAGKLLSSQLGVAPAFIAWSRFLIGTLFVLPFLPKGCIALFANWRIWFRAVLLSFGITSIQIALQTEMIATVFAAFFIGPLISFVLAAIFLREPVTPLRSVLIALGFLGVLVVVRPGMGASTGLLWAVAAGCSYGAFLTTSRWLNTLGSPIALVFSQLAISALLLAPFGLTQLPPFTGTIAALTITSAFCSMLGNLLLLYACQLVPATRVAPLVYFQLVAAVGLGWAVFGDLPDSWTWIGLSIIITSGLASTRLR